MEGCDFSYNGKYLRDFGFQTYTYKEIIVCKRKRWNDKRVLDVNSSPAYELEEVLKYYRKIEIMEK